MKMKKLVRTLSSPLLSNRYIRMLLAAYLYRPWIVPSEATVALRKREQELDESYWMGKLRQHAHIVDKGLHRGNFSKGRGGQAYGVAKTAFSYLRSATAQADPSVRWAASRIRLYEELQSGASLPTEKEYTATICRYEDLLDAIKSRRCVRCYLDRPVEDDVVDKIASVLDWSPTSCNRQPAEVYAANHPDIVRQCLSLYGGAACFTTIYAPLLLTFCADLRVYEMPAEFAMPYIDVALGVQNCLLAAHCLGISLTPLTWALHSGRQDRELRRILGIPPHLQIIVGAVGGYPAGGADVPARKKKNLFIRKHAAASA